MSLWSRVANVLRGDRLSREIEEELQSHLEEAAAQGRDPAEARRAFGSPLRQREESRDVRVIAWLDSLRADTVYGWRQLMKRKLTFASALLSLALAIGACTAAFRLIDALLLRPLPVALPDQLYAVAFQGTGSDAMVYDSCSYPLFLRMRSAVRQQAELIAVSYAESTDLTYGAEQEMEKAQIQFVSGWMFSSFGLQPTLGRLLSEHDDLKPGAHPVAVLSHDYWTNRFGGDRRVIGRKFQMGKDVYEVVGVAGESYTGTETGTVTGIFIPIMMKNPLTLASLNHFWLRTLVQLRPGVAAGPVRERLGVTFGIVQEERAKSFASVTNDRSFKDKLLLEPAASGRSNLQRDYRRPLTVLGILVILVLLIASANVANLMTAQAAARASEMALRISIGAGRWRLVQLMLVESAWLAFLATTIGALFAWWSAPFVVAMINPPDNPARLFLPADGRVLLFALALALGVTFLFGLAPALHASAVRPVSALKGGEDPHSRRRLMHTLIAVQVAFCFVVHFVAGLFIVTLDRVSNQPIGFSPAGILNLEALTVRPQLPAFWDQVAEHLRAVPGVESVALTGWPAMSGESWIGDVAINGARSPVFCDFVSASPGWIDTMKIPLLGGRDFVPSDANPTAAIVNEAFARQYFNGENPVGRPFEKLESGGARKRFQIVGLIPDARSRSDMRRPVRPTAYVPFHSLDATGALQAKSRGTFVVRASNANLPGLTSILRQEVPGARPEFRVSNIRTQIQINLSQTVRERLLAMLALFFAVVALLLAGIGLYGVLDYSVLQRRREIGIRIAIGAQAADIARRVTTDVFSMVLSGALAGLAAGMASVRYIGTLLFGVTPTNLGVLAIPSLLIFAAALLAAIPAVIRAVRIDPVTMLRSE